MAFKKKNVHTKVYAAIILVIIAIAAVAIAYVTIQHSSKSITVGVQVGDTFFYNLTGSSVLFDSEAVPPASLSEYNNTNYYQVTITGINGYNVSFDTFWTFTNGSAPIANTEWVNVATGANSGDFWAIYPSGLNINDLINPQDNNGVIVNDTGTQTYSTGSNRITDFWSIDNVFANSNDPTGSTQENNLIEVEFDRQTGMLTSLTNLIQYNNPEYNIVISWQLNSTNVWTV